MPTFYLRGKMKIFVIIIIIFSFNIVNAGELDGKGLICMIYGNTIGFFFEEERAYEYKPKGGREKLELSKKEAGKYYTDENNIFFDDIKINRKTLAFQKYSSFRGECKAFKNFEEFKKNFNIESLIKDNKI